MDCQSETLLLFRQISGAQKMIFPTPVSITGNGDQATGSFIRWEHYTRLIAALITCVKKNLLELLLSTQRFGLLLLWISFQEAVLSFSFILWIALSEVYLLGFIINEHFFLTDLCFNAREFVITARDSLRDDIENYFNQIWLLSPGINSALLSPTSWEGTISLVFLKIAKSWHPRARLVLIRRSSASQKADRLANAEK